MDIVNNTVQEEIFSSSYAAAAWLEDTKFPKDKKVQICSCVSHHTRRRYAQCELYAMDKHKCTLCHWLYDLPGMCLQFVVTAIEAMLLA